jgi:putative Ca2+/H+ antiporter (TMEM165/GDT1 family)
MNWKLFFSTFVAIFLAEMGDKTQLASLVLTAQSKKPLLVFLAASAALILASAIGVALGDFVFTYIRAEHVQRAAAVLFIGIGILVWFGIL